MATPLRSKDGKFAGSVGGGTAPPSGNPLAAQNIGPGGGSEEPPLAESATSGDAGDREMLTFEAPVVEEWYAGNREGRAWRVRGKLHRLDGPAVESLDVYGVLRKQEWYHDGKLHRLDGPAVVEWGPDGGLRCQKWMQNGKLHRLDEPAVDEWYPDGGLRRQTWMHDGKHHRLDGPAVEEWNGGGNLSFRAWIHDGGAHRLDGPAEEEWGPDGRLQESRFWVRGQQAHPDDPRAFEAFNPSTSPETLALLTRHPDSAVAEAAAANASCPSAARVEWALTRANGFT